MGTTEKLARFSAELQLQMIPEKAIEHAKNSLLDTVGTALLGSTRPLGEIVTRLVEYLGGNPHARVIGRGTYTSTPNAALANGTLAHAEDFDDMGAFGHVGAVLWPSILALSEELALPGERMLEAFVAAYEIGARLRSSIGNIQVERGYHNTGLFGTMAAACACAKLLGLDIDKTRTAFGIAACQGSGIIQNFGTYTKPLHAGTAARNGVLSAVLAKMGLTADRDIIEERRGFGYVFGTEQGDIARAAEGLGHVFILAEKGIQIKPWPCCGGNHGTINAILNLKKLHQIMARDVASVEVATSWEPPGSLIRTSPRTGFEGKFSLQYNAAAALLDDNIDFHSYSDEKLSNPMMRDLMSKVVHSWHPERRGKPRRLLGEARFEEVTIRLKDGRTYSERQENRGKQLVKEEIRAKYRMNAQIAGISQPDIEMSIQLIQKLEQVTDAKQLIDLAIRKPASGP